MIGWIDSLVLIIVIGFLVRYFFVKLRQLERVLSDSKKTELQLLENEQKISSIITHMESGILFINEIGKIQLVNDSVMRILDMEHYLIGNHHHDVTQNHELSELIDHCLENGEKRRSECYLYKSTEKIIDVNVVPLFHKTIRFLVASLYCTISLN